MMPAFAERPLAARNLRIERKPMQYDVIEAPTRASLVNQIELLIADGWQPQGGVQVIDIVTITPANVVRLWVQAVTKA